MSLLNYPDKECFSCQSDTWWYRSGEWICGECHPPVTELDTLRMRCRKANAMLSKIRSTYFEMSPEEKAEFDELTRKASAVAHELFLKNKDCLYLEKGNKIKKCIVNPGELTCFACPNEYWWVQELLEIADARDAKLENLISNPMRRLM